MLRWRFILYLIEREVPTSFYVSEVMNKQQPRWGLLALRNYNMAIYTKEASKIIGSLPQNRMPKEVKQIYDDTCAVKSQELILEDFGIHISETELAIEASQNGWFENGTPPQFVGNLLELHGIPVSHYENANIFNLVNELAQGHKVIVGVDSGELWHDDVLDQYFEDNRADHALIVSGINTADPNNIKVILTDPGTGDVMKEYPMEEFVDAWQDSNCYMVATDIAVPEIFKPIEEANDYHTPIAHIPFIGTLSYDLFYDDFAFLNYTFDIPPIVFDDFVDFVSGQINIFSTETLDFLDLN